MNRILLVDLGERELKQRNELRAKQQHLETLEKTAESSGGLSTRQLEELSDIRRKLGSDVVIDPFYRLVAATQQQLDWAELQDANQFVHEYGLMGSQRMVGKANRELDKNEREIIGICGLMQVDGYTDAARPDFVQRISAAQGEYRRHRSLFDAAFAQLGQQYPVSLRSQVQAGLIDRHVVGCVSPGGDPRIRAEALDPALSRQVALRSARAADKRVREAEEAAEVATQALNQAKSALAARKADLKARKSKENADAVRAAEATVAAAEKNVLATNEAAEMAGLASEDARRRAVEANAADDLERIEKAYEPRQSETVCALSGRNIAAVVRRLASSGTNANDAWLASRIQNTYDMQTGVVGGAPASSMEINLPDLDEATDVEIVRENLHAVQAIYFAYMLEEMRLPQVVERIVELFRGGLLPLGRGKAGDYLFNYYKKSGERITEGERRDLYMRVFGAPGGDPGNNQPNREFNELWLRFISAVSSFARQLTVDRLLRSHIPVAVSQEQVRKAGRDLAANLSLHGYGIAYFAATELQSMILEFRDKLSDPEIKGAFGARDMWQVVDQVNANYLGGTRNTHRYRTQARAGAVIIRWLANHHQRLSGRFGEVVSLAALSNPQLRGSDQPTVEPNDWDLVQACEQWLAVGGVNEQSIELYSQPTESPVITSSPIQMPAFARDAIDSLTGGLNGGMTMM
jgi:hypothetical protein